jgi:GntR family transcriptional regulator, rspAB operon transcriptional repressor
MGLSLAERGGAADLGPVGLQVRRIIEERIITHVLRPGERLSESELSSQLGVSRQPVREALIRLTEAGLVRVLPQRGTVVTRISVTLVNSARFVREAVERVVVRQAAGQATPEAIRQMRAIIRAQSDAIEAEDHATFLRLDDELHRSFAVAIGLEEVWRSLQPVKLHMDRVRYLSLPDATPGARLLEQHTGIVEAIAKGNAEAAEAIMHQHLSELLSSLPRLVAKLPDYFDGVDQTD